MRLRRDALVAGIESKIGELGSKDLVLPVLTLGKGSPHVAVLCGLHGDELSSFLVASRLRDIDIRKGSLHIFVGVNEAAQLLGRRFVDLDVNRVFPGRSNGRLEERLAAVLFDKLQNMDLVVDLHCFEMETPVTALQFSDDARFVDLFNPDIVWLLDDPKYSRSLGPLLCSHGIPNFAVELNSLEHFNEADRVLKGLENVLRSLGMLDGVSVTSSPLRLSRTEITSDVSGIFVPEMGPLDPVSEGDVVGRLLRLRGLDEEFVKSPVDGVIMQVRRKCLVRTGDPVFAIGERR